MPPSNNPVTSGPPSIGGPFNPLSVAQKDLNATEAKLLKFKKLIFNLTLEADKGSDDALDAGYSHLDRNRIDKLVRECRTVKSMAEKVEKDVRIKKDVMEQLQSPSRLSIIRNTPDEQDGRRRAAFRVLKLLASSPANFHVFLGGLGIEVTPEIKAALNVSLAQASDSQTNQWLQGAQRNEETLALQTKFDEQRAELVEAKREAQVQRELVEKTIRDKDDAERKATDAISQSASECARAKGDMRKANEQSMKFQGKVEEVTTKQLKLRAEINRLQTVAEAEKDTSARDISKLKLEIAKLQEARDGLVAAKGALEVDLDELQERHNTEVKRLQGEKEVAEKSAAESKKQLKVAQSSLQKAQVSLQETQVRLQMTKSKLETANSDLRKARNSFATSKSEADRAKEDCRSLRATTLEQQNVLLNKDQKILELAVASNDRNILLTSREEEIKTQVQQASNFIRRLSINVKSEVWQKVAEKVVVNSTRTQATTAQWHPWTICSSWSADMALGIRQDDRSLDAVALDVLAILDVKSANIKDLLSRLQSFQDAMKKSSVVPTITQLLLGALTNAVGDSRLHLMHRVAMCQVAHLLAPTAEALLTLEQAMDAVDIRVNRLVSALKAFDLSAQLQLGDSISYEDIALVGFGRNPHGIVALSSVGRELCWIDYSHIRREYSIIELVPNMGDPIRLPMDNMERLSWAMAHL